MNGTVERKPPWIRLPRSEGEGLGRVRRTLRERALGTVCEEARCPNRSECWGCGTATFLLMGRSCTRGCRFCAVATSRIGEPLDESEPERIAEAVEALELRFAVLTSVSRDDLEDGGAGHYARTIEAIRARCPGVGVEVLIPDYLGEPLATVLEAKPDVLAHNVEVVRAVTGAVRDARCDYDRSLEVLRAAKSVSPSVTTKSSLLLGLGESDEQVLSTMDDLRAASVDILCIGQYLQPGRRQLPVDRYLRPERFEELGAIAEEKGFSRVVSGPLVRTSYRALEVAPGFEEPRR